MVSVGRVFASTFPPALQPSAGLGETEVGRKGLFEVTQVVDGCFSLFLLVGTQLLEMGQGAPR